MFVEECCRVAAEFPDVEVDEVIVDTMAMRLIRDPQSFDMIVTTNMFGDILTDEAAGLVGGLGMAPGLCIGEGALAMAQATHGSAPDIAGRGYRQPVRDDRIVANADRMARTQPGHRAGGRRGCIAEGGDRRRHWPIRRPARATSAAPAARPT